jgi:hypothetical protein
MSNVKCPHRSWVKDKGTLDKASFLELPRGAGRLENQNIGRKHHPMQCRPSRTEFDQPMMTG